MTDRTFDENPWSAEFWNLTRQGAYIKKYGLEVAKTKAKQAGVKLGAPVPRNPALVINNLTIIQRKSFGGGIVGAGSSGDGAP